MSVITDVVDITITAADAKVSTVGFGLPLIVSHTASWVERVREYASAAEVLADFAATKPEYLAASALFAATPRPPKVLIGRAALKPTQRFRLTPVVNNSYTYRVTINGTQVSFTSDGTATAAEIIAGLTTEIDNLGLDLTCSDQTTYLRVVADNAGDWFNFQCDDLVNLPLLQDHADPGIATDLAAIALERNDWYALGTLFNSAALVEAAAAWALTNKKLYVVQTVDGVVPNTAISGTDDVAEYLRNASNNYAAVIFSKATGDFADMAWLGRCLPTRPGTETWKFKTLAGVQAGSYTATQIANMRAKRCNFYDPTEGANMTQEGYTSSGRFIDLTRFIDYLSSTMATAILEDLLDADKIPMDDPGISVVLGEVMGTLKAEESARTVLPGWTATAPLAASISNTDRQNRLLPNVRFAAVYSGAIHKVTINGTLS